MQRLSRTIRFFVNLDGDAADHLASDCVNSYAAWPGRRGVGAYYELTATCVGTPDPGTGYLANVATIDRTLRTHALPRIYDSVRTRPAESPESTLAELAQTLTPLIEAPLERLEWRFSPFHSIAIETNAMTTALLTQQFDFAAAHRLHSTDLTDEENAAVFGKCNNEHYHGHNYKVEVTASTGFDGSQSTGSLSVETLETTVAKHVIDRFDHKNLNLDVPEFTDVNPTVEAIAATAFDLLAAPIAAAGGTLEEVTVWETEKTSCTVRREN